MTPPVLSGTQRRRSERIEGREPGSRPFPRQNSCVVSRRARRPSHSLFPRPASRQPMRIDGSPRLDEEVWMATSADVARLAGVSQSTVSYVMSGTRSISAETRARVEAAMRQLDYHPNAGARALAGRRTNVVGLVVRFAANTDVAALLPFIETISSFCRERDYDVVLVTEDEGPAGLQRLAGRAIVDGIVLMDIRRDDDRVPAAHSVQVPVVLIGIPDDPRDLDCVDVDVEAAGRLAVRELAEAGHRHITLIGESPVVRADQFGFVAQFAESVESAAADAGIAVSIYQPDAEGWAGFTRFESQAAELAAVRAGVIARTPQAIDMTLQILQVAGVMPGKDVSLVGVCTDSTAEAFRIPVTNISPEPREVSRLAMESLFARLDGRPAERGVQLVSPRLTRRRTTARPH
ncbi:LacI family transcriptional regulator [Microbacterium sp. JZ70]